MNSTEIQSYLEKNTALKWQIPKSVYEAPEGAEPYLQILRFIGEHPEFAEKFCGRLSISFAPGCRADIWREAGAVRFVKSLTDCPFLFFLAEKEGNTLKLLAALSCYDGRQSGDELALDKSAFSDLLRNQLKGIVLMSKLVRFTPERAQSFVVDVLTYFGMDA
ncbi:MAG: hypothetical protein LKE33_00730 [Acidaminococcus sp.]|jgi:hypothetical protein|nr:hypothetical protein [Acidaminococcus sp.]MCI2100066.1 hypothetical protein [Acidaminococcus sp.]MCI2114336.1 hypothetical protein [Acidaminococcus sp.]MCI2116277.1 hypothetical protein [Acidaminococcus sp.]